MDALAAAEAKKYRHIWERPEYRRYSPGEAVAADAVAWFRRFTEGWMVIDYGCGSGRAASAIGDAGYTVLGVDIARNCLDEGSRVQMVEACLWSLPAEIHGDFCFCADVMEHIPEEKVDEVLRVQAERTPRAAYYQIATGPDGCGRLIGETLHLTVRPFEWWVERLSSYWPKVAASHRGSVLARCSA